MTDIGRFLKQSSHYSLANILGMASGLISFPILTWVFAVSDYGILSLANVTILLSMTFAKLGMQHSVVRFYGEVKAQERAESQSQFYSTFFFVSLLFSCVVTFFISRNKGIFFLFGDPKLLNILSLVAVLVFISGVSNILGNFLRAEQRTGGIDLKRERDRVSKWIEFYPKLTDRYRDANGELCVR